MIFFIKYFNRILGFFIGNIPEIDQNFKKGKIMNDLYIDWLDKFLNSFQLKFKSD